MEVRRLAVTVKDCSVSITRKDSGIQQIFAVIKLIMHINIESEGKNFNIQKNLTCGNCMELKDLISS